MNDNNYYNFITKERQVGLGHTFTSNQQQKHYLGNHSLVFSMKLVEYLACSIQAVEYLACSIQAVEYLACSI